MPYQMLNFKLSVSALGCNAAVDVSCDTEVFDLLKTAAMATGSAPQVQEGGERLMALTLASMTEGLAKGNRVTSMALKETGLGMEAVEIGLMTVAFWHIAHKLSYEEIWRVGQKNNIHLVVEERFGAHFVHLHIVPKRAAVRSCAA
ncbi:MULTISPECIES: hypothetical protein [unclassified Shinella]|uniref:hypothetical protein n=1 Tax=unclassified Shinella TaxID=2643062 RepID=UPI00234EBC3E|nr:MULTISPECIES: hypothetical protein [unclassified Shinella]MCO5152829.1 hypothetical protein [Shinella sp.]MDC7260821.1 hypothetical protein [Shinella sp. HY16]MDC7267716.1 hypothetical protein [Shinella sp. YZ44]